MAFPHEPVRPRNTVMLFKQETTTGVDASPTTADAFPFENDGWNYNAPYAAEDSNENTGTLVAGAPLIVGRPAEVTFRVRMKGAGVGTTYTAGVKPPHHALLQCCGWRGLFTAAIAAEALTAGTTTTATLGSSFSTNAQQLRGLPLQLAGGTSGGRLVHVSNYTSGRVATLTDLFASALTTSVTAAMLANWSYAPTSPADAASRATDHPSGTLYIYEDGRLLKFVGMRGSFSLTGENARPGFASFSFMGIFAGETTVAVPSVTVPLHTAPVLAMGDGGVNPAFLMDRVELAAKNWSTTGETAKEVRDDPNTPFGFGSPDLDLRTPTLVVDPLATYKSNIDRQGQIVASTSMSAVLRHGQSAGNRWSLTIPTGTLVESGTGERGIFRTDELQLRAFTGGRDPSSRDGDMVLCFY